MATAKEGADAWKKTTEELRQRFNDAGGNVGKLEDWGKPQHHSQARVASAGIDQWIGDILPVLRSRCRVRECGRIAHEYRAAPDLLSGMRGDQIITDGQKQWKRAGQRLRRWRDCEPEQRASANLLQGL